MSLYNDGGPVGWWTFDYPSGTSAYDSSGEGNTGSFNGDPTHTFTDCADGFCLDFDGTGDYVYLWDDSTADTITNDGVYTLSEWVKSKTTAGDTDGRVFTRDCNSHFCIYVNQGSGYPQDMYFRAGNAVTYSNVLNSGWHHVAMACDANDCYNYLDGELLGTITYGSGANNRPIIVGDNTEASPSPGSSPFEGKLDDIRIYNYALSSGQVKRLYNKGLTRHEGGLNIYKSCLDLRNHAGAGASGTYVIDPDGYGGNDPVAVYCDMETDGGGWTLVGKIDGKPSIYNSWLRTDHNKEQLADLTMVSSGDYASFDAVDLGVQSSYVRFSNTDITKWVKSPLPSDTDSSTLWNHGAGCSTIDAAADTLVTVEDQDGNTESCYINPYMIMPLCGHGGSYPAWTINTNGNTATGDLCMAVGVLPTGETANGFSQNGNGYDSPSSDTDWPNSAYTSKNYLFVWLR